MIRKGDTLDLETLMELTRACAKHMINKGIYQWNEHYPNKQAFQTDIDRKELYILEKDDMLVGCVVLSILKDEEYTPIQWLSRTEQNLYVHRLAVHPQFQGQGYAQQLMSFAEEQARQQGFESIRLDTFSQNPRNQQFYEQRGYHRLGNIYFPKQSEHPFYCYELLL